MLRTFGLLALCFSLSTCEETLDCTNKGKKSTMMRLKTDLLCGYDKYTRPVIYHTNKTTVQLIIAPRMIAFIALLPRGKWRTLITVIVVVKYEDHNIVHMKTWIGMNWTDGLLKWDKSLYENIDQIMLDTDMVWVPDLHVYNSVDDTSLDRLYAPVVVGTKGQVRTFMNPTLTGHCLPNWVNWPYDTQVCAFTLGSKRFHGDIVDFTFLYDKDGLTMFHYLPNNYWSIVDTNASRYETLIGGKNETISIVTLEYKFTLKRHTAIYVATYIIPGVVMVIFSLGVLCIPPDKTERLAVLCTLVILQSLFLQYLGYKLPANGDTTPYLVCFYRDCLVLTCFLLVETLVTRSMLSWQTNPTYLQSTLQFVARNKVLQMVLVSDIDPQNAAMLMEAGNDEGSALVTSDKNVQQWHTFVKIINRTFFILLVPIYFLLSLSLLPLNYSISIN